MKSFAVFAFVVIGFGPGTTDFGPQPDRLFAGPCDPAVSRCL